ncbi:unnamed protein product [Closterium sp. NIES-64]|nr:unnamed protein product [Closterium sp. NIES-64]
MAITGENSCVSDDDDALYAATEMLEARTGLDFLVSVLSHEKEKPGPVASVANTGEASGLCRGDDRPQPAHIAKPAVPAAAGPSIHLPSRASSSKPPPRYKQVIDLLAIQGQIRRTTTHINSHYVDCGDDFGGGLSEKLSPFIARHGPNGVRRVEVEWVDSDGRPTSHCYVLHDSPLEGYPIAGTHERCVEQCTAMAEALVHNLDERLGSLDKLSGVKLFMPDEWPHGRQERSMVCTEHLESLTMLFRAQESDEIVPDTAYKKRKPITTMAAPKKQPRAKGKEKVDEDDAGGAGSGWGTETPLHRHGSMSDGGGSDEDEDMCVM